MASLLVNIEKVHELYNEIDHIVSFASQGWTARNGAIGTRVKQVQPADVTIRVGVERQVFLGPERRGGSATPPNSAQNSSRSLPPVQLSASLRAAGGPTAGTARSIGSSRGHRAASDLEDYVVPDFVLTESPMLADMHRTTCGAQSLGPIRRNKDLFAAVVTLMKLRWLTRLHSALVILGGHRCSLQRLLLGLLSDTCCATDEPHGATTIFDALAETLRTRFQASWPIFLGFVATHDCEPQGTPRGSPQSSRFPGSSAGVAVASDAGAGGTEGSGNGVFLMQIIDDIFSAWLVQQDPQKLPAEQVMKELDHFQLERPVIRTGLDSLRSWQAALGQPATQQTYVKMAQRQAHQLALLVEMPSMRPRWQHSSDELIEVARNIVAHPRTFCAGLRVRVAAALEGAASTSVFEAEQMPPPAVSKDMDEEQMLLYLSYTSDPRDRGRIKPSVLDTLRDSRAPWLLGRESRYPQHTDAWLQRKLVGNAVLDARTTPRSGAAGGSGLQEMDPWKAGLRPLEGGPAASRTAWKL